MEKFIEVTGEAEYDELPSKIIIDVDITVQAAKKESAEKELKEILNTTLDTLFNNGLTKEEVSFGGKELYTPWWNRKKSGVESRSRITITTENRASAYEALEAIEKFSSHKRITVTIGERQPIFKADETHLSSALNEAMQNALNKAKVLARSLGVTVGKALIIQETNRSVRGSGSYGDHDWGGSGMFLETSFGEAGSAEPLEIEPASRISDSKRIVTIKYKVKFALE